MRNAKATFLIVLAVLLFSPRPAFAQWDIIKWIQELSGPGPFAVFKGADINVLCVPKRSASPGEVIVPPGTRYNPREYQWLFCDKRPYTWRNVQRFYGFNVGIGEGNNNLVFPTNLPPKDKVTLSVLTFRGAWRVDDMLDIGSLVGFHRFSATPSIVLSRFVIDPYVGVRPLGWIGRESSTRTQDFFAKLFEVTFGVTFYPEGFTAQDFGASGTKSGSGLTGGAEAIPHVGLKVAFTF